MPGRVLTRASDIASNLLRILGSPAARLIGAGILVFVWIAVPVPTTSDDASNFWSVDLADPYKDQWGSADAFVYSPTAVLFLAPFKALPFAVFYKLLLAANMAAMIYMVGWMGAALALLLPPVQVELQTGNIHLLIGAALVFGFRRPAIWAFPILTKVTPAVGLIWFGVRREWRALLIALGTTSTLVAVTWLIVPWMWADWLDVLRDSGTVVIMNYTVAQVPVFVRLPFAAGLVYIAARRGDRWLVPIAVFLALPAMWVGALSMLLAVFPLLSPQSEASPSPVAESAVLT
ncbi:MAG TPA: glycosyltransferase family 87 protein [Candidatus Limnocylindria bacterium]|nr:glycosyltransferase family 87 protein [Candidatus Limnocylindria bacterium]